MLDVNTLPKRYRKVEEFENFDECYSQMRFRSKRTEEEELIQNKVCEKVARYVVQRQLTSYLYPNTASAPSDRCSNSRQRHLQTIGRYS
jgi:hypothetical protein